MNNVEAVKVTSRKDLVDMLEKLVDPLISQFDGEGPGLKFDTGGTHYSQKTRQIEALLRPLWGIVPLLAGGTEYKGLERYIARLKEGINPDHPHYFGETHDYDQRLVEMAVIGLALCICGEKWLSYFNEKEQNQLHAWLNQINDREVPENNWIFFRILVNHGFRLNGFTYNEVQLKKDLELVHSYYRSEGWYVDGYLDQIDYYVPFALHFYGLVYAKTADEEDQHARIFVERSKEFAQSFACFFDGNGAAVPFGRSMTYRFAQVAFFSAAIFAEIEVLPYSEMKWLVLKHLNHWLKQSIFSHDGLLTVGYYYRNQVFAEGYNAFGSPYWALKSFLLLGLPEEHPFWLIPEKAPELPSKKLIAQARFLVTRDQKNTQVQLYTAGLHCEPHTHCDAKYEKFVYSSVFGFSVSKGQLNLRQGAFDNTLAVSLEPERYYKMRYEKSNYQVTEEYLLTNWNPYEGVRIRSIIVPFTPFHFRIHMIESDKTIYLADGSFALGFDIDGVHMQKKMMTESNQIKVMNDEHQVGLIDFSHQSELEFVFGEPNSNIMKDQTYIPTAKDKVEKGKHLLIHGFYGTLIDDTIPEPNCTIDENKIILSVGQDEVSIPKSLLDLNN
ncbi:DUF2264 domain-containing protein [Neobacillus cucumis]|uniref:DUF2264 domain-containing protein n=1 Tax=Neobacillus cucumis TaxID=1740721 RepID=UPI001966505F|nr:DUF2264 domain-containing protein [Neobacillus cucumis]MBM7654326.1 hypothetical protein [Neobacillus cucumis]